MAFKTAFSSLLVSKKFSGGCCCGAAAGFKQHRIFLKQPPISAKRLCSSSTAGCLDPYKSKLEQIQLRSKINYRESNENLRKSEI
ncbi:hypothetical protein CUMW_247600 [Citrus unshiu]|uniref:Uncharacterized protein n=1 Tax=Citrus unshiu TaxID=55188 RepID=A0A2H5QNX6_CITUN|nr:hypothetical protein CUMW_247600 [Citrus unshiu]